MMDSAARFLSRSPAVIRKSLPLDDQDDEEQLIGGGLPARGDDAETAEIEALKNIDRGETHPHLVISPICSEK